jgi:cell division GTPase FtsZ
MNFNNKFAKIIGVSEDGIKNLEYIINYKNNKNILSTEEISMNQDIDKDYAAKILDEVEILFITYNSKEQRTCDIVKAINYMAQERRIVSIGIDINEDNKKVEFDFNAEFMMNTENKDLICELIDMMVESVSEESTINIDLTDLKEILSKEKGLAHGFIERDKSVNKDELVEMLFNSILKTNEDLTKKKGIVFISLGNDYCKIEEVLFILSEMLENIQSRIDSKCDLIFTLALNENLKDKIRMGILYN